MQNNKTIKKAPRPRGKEIKILLVGACGKMGRVVAQKFGSQICCGIDKEGKKYANFEVYKSFNDMPKCNACSSGVVLDFSNPSMQADLVKFCHAHKLPLVVATTGLDETQRAALKTLSKTVPVFIASNFSYGISVLKELIMQAQKMLDGWDIEIVEKHHSHKADAPSGTSLTLANALATKKTTLKNGRVTADGMRKPNEIGMHALRGGTVVGDHEINFFGEHEVITISHSAQSKDIFAIGAFKACGFVAGKKSGYYEMKDLV